MVTYPKQTNMQEKSTVQMSVKHPTLPVYIGNSKQDMATIGSDKKVYVRCSVLGLCSLHRRVDQSSSSLARLASVIEPLELASGKCSSVPNPRYDHADESVLICRFPNVIYRIP